MNQILKQKILLHATWIVSLGLYIFSLTRECYCVYEDCLPSSLVLVMGGLGMLVDLGTIANYLTELLSKHPHTLNHDIGASFAWLANPLVILSWFYIKRRTVCFRLSVLAGIASISFLFFDKVIHNEAGNYDKVTAYKSGYWLWLACMLVMIAGNVVLKKVEEKSSKKLNG